MNKGKLIIFSAPSGAGKTTIVRYLLERELNLAFSVSATSRKPRINETDGLDYYFLDNETFMKKVNNGEFLEWEEVYAGTCYGTLKSEVERLTSEGKNVLFDVDVVGGINIKKFYGSEALSIFVQPPSIDELRKRLNARNTDAQEVIEKRVAKAAFELTFAPQFDKVLINNTLTEAQLEAENLVRNFINTPTH
jgi:guanylate kinase